MASSAPETPLPSATPDAVFLSYAREDNDAARRIADALRSDPSWDPLRADPRFDELLKELGAKK